MDTDLLDQAFRQATPSTAKTLQQHFGETLLVSDAELQKEGENFLKTMATWVYRKFSDRRKNGVPLGYLDKFVLPADRPIDFTRTLMLQLVRTMRQRGLREYDLSKKSPLLEELGRAFDNARKARR
jgi:hypothetical protein